MLALHSRVLLLTSLCLMTAVGIAFYRKQNATAGRMGGAISVPKILWLIYAITVWFFIAPIVAADGAVSAPLRIVLGSFAGWMWIRGIAELLMMYRFKNWSPKIGITHDVTCILVLAGGLAQRALVVNAVDRWVLAFAACVAASLVVEIAYAALFFGAVKGKTHGEDGIWFADEKDPKFIFINRLTAACNVPLFAFQALFLAAMVVEWR